MSTFKTWRTVSFTAVFLLFFIFSPFHRARRTDGRRRDSRARRFRSVCPSDPRISGFSIASPAHARRGGQVPRVVVCFLYSPVTALPERRARRRPKPHDKTWTIFFEISDRIRYSRLKIRPFGHVFPRMPTAGHLVTASS